MKKLFAFVLLSGICMAVHAQRTALKDGGFESPKLNAWNISSSNVTADDVDYMEGLQSVRIQAFNDTQDGICISQVVNIQADDHLICGSFFYKLSEGNAGFVIDFKGKDGLKPIFIKLDATKDWQKKNFEFKVPNGAKTASVEIRLNKQGTMHFDALDLKFYNSKKEEKTVDLLFVNSKRISKVYKEGLEKNGFKNIRFCDWKNLTPKLLQKSRCVVVFPMLKLSLSTEDEAKIELLKEYVRQGGGLMFNHGMEQMKSRTILSYNIGKTFDLRIHWGTVIFPKNTVRRLGDQAGDIYAEAGKDIPEPFNKGVSKVIVPASPGSNAIYGCVPFTAGADWKVILTAGEGSTEMLLNDSLLDIFIEMNKGITAYTNHVPVVAVRQYGKGHAAYVGMDHACSFAAGDSSAVGEKIIRQVFTENGLMQFMVNLHRYLSSGSDSLCQAKLPDLPAKVKSPAIAQERVYRGIIGPRTTYSTGTSTVAEYVAAAKKAGLDYIVFLEEFSKLSRENFEKLRRDCRKYTDQTFSAYPGFTYRNVDGNHQYVYGDQPLYPSDLLLDANRNFKTVEFKVSSGAGMDLIYLYKELSFEANSGWYDFSHNPYPYYDMRSVCTMGVVTQENGKTTDFSEAPYADTNRSVQFICPQALTLMHSAEEMKYVLDGTYYHNEMKADSLAQFRNMLSTKLLRNTRNRFPGTPTFGSIFITQGPVLMLSMPRGDMNPKGDLYAPVLRTWPLNIKATAPEGISAIEIYDGDTLLKRYYPNGTSFEMKTILSNDRQRHVWGKLISKTGKIAITRSMSSDSWILRDTYCMDRNNPLLYSLRNRKDGSTILTTHAADGVLPWKGPWYSRLRPVGAYVMDSVYGKGKLRFDGSPEFHPQVSMRPVFFKKDNLAPRLPNRSWQGQMIPGIEGGSHNKPHTELLSSNVMIASQELDGVYPLNAYPIIHTHSTLFPFKKSEYIETKAVRTLWLYKAEGLASWLWEQDIKILKDYPVDGPKKFAITPGCISPFKAALKRAWLGGKLVKKPSGVISLQKGDILVYEGNFYGTLAVYVLNDGMKYDCSNFRFVFTADNGILAAGTTYHIKLLCSGINRLEKDPFATALQYGRDLGIVEPGKTGYTVQAKAGKVISTEFTLDVAGPFSGTINGISKINGYLGMRLFGMRDNCGAMLACNGKKRIIPVEKNVAYAVLTEQESDKPVVAGHPFLPEDNRIMVSISGNSSRTKWIAEIHNPAKQIITTKVKQNAELTGNNAEETLTLAPGAVILREFK